MYEDFMGDTRGECFDEVDRRAFDNTPGDLDGETIVVDVMDIVSGYRFCNIAHLDIHVEFELLGLGSGEVSTVPAGDDQVVDEDGGHEYIEQNNTID